MASVVNTNIPSLIAQRNLTVNNRKADTAMQRLSSGLRINSAADDAAGLAISEKMRGQIRGLKMAAKNALDSSSLFQVAEGALDQTNAMLIRMRELAVQSANDTNTEDDRIALENEVIQLKKEVDRIANTTEFNTKKLLDGNLSGVRSEVAGRVSVNNNSALIFKDVGTNSLAALKERIGASGVYDGMISIVKLVDGTPGSNSAAYKIIFNNGVTSSGKQIAVTGYSPLGSAYGTVSAGAGMSASNGIAANVGEHGVGNVTIHTGASLALSVTIGSHSITINGLLGNGGSALTLDFATNNTTFAGLDAGDAFTMDFSRYEAAGGNLDKGVMTQLGANAGQITFGNIQDMRCQALGLRYTSIETRDQAQAALSELDNASIKVSAQRSLLGAIQNRLSYAINALEITTENVTAAESRIRDADMAAEMSDYTKENVKSQAAQAMVSQANARANQVLGLLQ